MVSQASEIVVRLCAQSGLFHVAQTDFTQSAQIEFDDIHQKERCSISAPWTNPKQWTNCIPSTTSPTTTGLSQELSQNRRAERTSFTKLLRACNRALFSSFDAFERINAKGQRLTKAPDCSISSLFSQFLNRHSGRNRETIS
jgi:hypothetical protein